MKIIDRDFYFEKTTVSQPALNFGSAGHLLVDPFYSAEHVLLCIHVPDC